MNAKLINDDCLIALQGMEADSVDSLVTDPPAGISFMGKAWDHHKGGRDSWIEWMTEVMRECYRVLKPGAHGLVWAIPRTSHWTATALEDAGFEVRDVVTHLFGSGFPKSLDISKAIDKAAGATRELVGLPSRPDGSSPRTNVVAGFTTNSMSPGVSGTSDQPMTAPSTDAAKQWSGFGTALKPASEHWILVRKPCSEKTVAKNVLKHGVGGINIDGCRVGSGDDRTPGGLNSLSYETPTGTMNIRTNQTQRPSGGRFPANLVLSHTIFCTDDECDDTCAVKMLDEQSGHLLSSKRKPQTNSGHQNKYIGGDVVNKVPRIDYAGDGGASRFFYVAKASKSDRGAGNSHPTVKASKLMRYLIRLVTPPNGTVLDPFMGSGSTGVAAKQEGFNFIGIEREEDYLAIAQARMDAFL